MSSSAAKSGFYGCIIYPFPPSVKGFPCYLVNFGGLFWDFRKPERNLAAPLTFLGNHVKICVRFFPKVKVVMEISLRTLPPFDKGRPVCYNKKK